MQDKEEIDSIRIFTQKSEMDKAFQTLDGILDGITADWKVTELERIELLNWCEIHRWLLDKHPFNEIMPTLMQALEESSICVDTLKDVQWLVRKICSNHPYYDVITADIQRLEGMLHGFLADNEISDTEIHLLVNWLDGNRHLMGIYPYDEISAILAGILRDGIVTNDERNYLTLFMSEFVNRASSSTIDFNAIDALKKSITIDGICAVDPAIEFDGRLYCFTGTSERVKRKEFVEIIEVHGGMFNDNVLKNTDYLVVGNSGNPCWAYSCYGRKVEKAIELRKQGAHIHIVNEIDFWDCLL
jgi:NAD-dependent DNA ligase